MVSLQCLHLEKYETRNVIVYILLAINSESLTRNSYVCMANNNSLLHLMTSFGGQRNRSPHEWNLQMADNAWIEVVSVVFGSWPLWAGLNFFHPRVLHPLNGWMALVLGGVQILSRTKGPGSRPFSVGVFLRDWNRDHYVFGLHKGSSSSIYGHLSKTIHIVNVHWR